MFGAVNTTNKHTTSDPSSLELLFIPGRQKDYSTRVAVNRHINRYVRRTKKNKQNAQTEALLLQRDFAFHGPLYSEYTSQELQYSITDPGKLLFGAYDAPSSLRPGLETWHIISEHLEEPISRKLFHYATNVFWPGFDPGGDAVHSPFVANFWVYNTVKEPILIHAFLWAASLHLNIRTRTTPRSYRVLKHCDLLIQGLKTELFDPSQAARDAVLLAILSLHPDIDSTPASSGFSVESFFPPLQDLQSIDVYSRMPFIQSHGVALVKLVKLRGGLDKLSMPGLGPLMQYTDILSAAMHLRPPQFELCNFYRQTQMADPVFPDDVRGGLLHRHINEGTQRLLDAGLDERVFGILVRMRQFTSLILLYHEQRSAVDLARLALHRNVIQHSLLSTISLPPTLPIQSSRISVQVTEIVRDALLAFSLGVIFPTVYIEPHRTLAFRLKSLLMARRHFNGLDSCDDTITWACFIGALTSTLISNEVMISWFVNELVELELLHARNERAQPDAPHSCRPWHQIKLKLEQFAWLAPACDYGAILIWSRVEETLENIV